MTKDQEGYVLAGSLIDEQTEVTLDEVTLFCSVRREQIVALVEEGVLEPKGGESGEWRFAGHSLRRAAKAIRLQRDLEINLSAVALVLDLLDQIESLRAQLPLDNRS
jgi:chaperone modulatory protein CbpM